MTRKLTFAVFAALFIAGTAAAAEWYDNYDEGIAAVRKGQWQTVVQKMTAAIAVKPQENDKLRTYGTQFYNYHPYYYRAAAYLNLGEYEKAIKDLQQATGPGEENLGSIDTLMQRAKSKLAQASAPEPQPVAPQPQPVAPQPRPVVPTPQPAAPAISPAMRQQAAAAISEADAARAKAQSRNAGSSPAFTQALSSLADARQKSATAKSDDDLNAAIASAGNAKMFFDSATGPTAVATAPAKPVPQPPSKVTSATNLTMKPTQVRVRSALEAYFRGDFSEAAQAFSQLSQELPNNGWIYAFLGASQYSLYAFELDDNYKTKATESFKKAKELRFKNGELPARYFSKRIRHFFKEVG